MWPEHFLEAKKCLARYEQAMNNREWDVARLQAGDLHALAAAMSECALEEQSNANQQG